MKLNECLQGLHHKKILKEKNPDILHLEIDSRLVKENTLFFCISGHQIDGHQFAGAAVAKGALAIIAERPLDVEVPVVLVPDTRRALAMISDAFYQHPSQSLHLIGVTGTNGKTSVTHLIKTIQDRLNIPTGTIGTMGIFYNGKEIPVLNTTPESHVLQNGFQTMLNEGIKSVTMEVSSHALHQGRVRGCDFNIALFTNLSQDHLDYHNTMTDYMYAKGLLFAQLGNTYDHNSLKAAVLNSDDPVSKELAHMTSAEIYTYGIHNEADFKAENIKISAVGTSFILKTQNGTYPVQMQLMGAFSVYNILAAIACGYLGGLTIPDMLEVVQDIKGINGRFEAVHAGQSYSVIVDYSHTPDSLENALNTIREFATGKVITVIGCGGDRDKTKRPLMAKTAVNASDLTLLTSDNPRTEDPVTILKNMETGAKGGKYKVIVDRSEAIKYAVQHAEENDIILIAGKGHETYQIIGQKKIDFDDRVVAREAIRERMSR